MKLFVQDESSFFLMLKHQPETRVLTNSNNSNCLKTFISNRTKTVKVEEATASVTIGSLGNNITMKESDEENLDDDWLWRHKHSSTQAFTSFLVSKLAGAFVLFRLFFFIGLPFHISICTIVCVWFLKLYSVYFTRFKVDIRTC